MAVLTKRELALTLLKLLETRTLDEITVIDVVNAYGVNRQTFYYHFRCMDDLIKYMFKYISDKTVGEYKTYRTWQKGFENMFNYVLANKKIIMNINNSKNIKHFQNNFKVAGFKFLLDVIDEVAYSLGIRLSRESREYIANFYDYVFVGILLDWINDGMIEKPKKIVSRLSDFIEGDIQDKIKLLASKEDI